MTLGQLAIVRRRDSQGGAKKGSVDHWMGRLLQMYHERSALAFMNVNRLFLASDNACHSGKDTMITIAANPETQVACYMTSQVVSSLKLVRPDDFELEPAMEVLCAQREQERLAAYKWLQALDNQVRLLSQKSEQPLTLESFTPHFRHFLTPHQPGDIRHVGPNGATVQRGEDHFEVDMEGATELPVAAIMLDQCAVGMSAAAWWRSDAPLLCHFVWDKLHRVANDLKLSKSKTQNEVMLKTVFIWGANYRPFRSGGFFTEKQEVICAFLASESWESWFRSSSRWLSLFFPSHHVVLPSLWSPASRGRPALSILCPPDWHRLRLAHGHAAGAGVPFQ